MQVLRSVLINELESGRTSSGDAEPNTPAQTQRAPLRHAQLPAGLRREVADDADRTRAAACDAQTSAVKVM